MATFSFGTETHASITKPLAAIVEKLTAYIKKQESNINALEVQKSQIMTDIKISEKEIRKSNKTCLNIQKMIGTDDEEDTEE